MFYSKVPRFPIAFNINKTKLMKQNPSHFSSEMNRLTSEHEIVQITWYYNKKTTDCLETISKRDWPVDLARNLQTIIYKKFNAFYESNNKC